MHDFSERAFDVRLKPNCMGRSTYACPSRRSNHRGSTSKDSNLASSITFGNSTRYLEQYDAFFHQGQDPSILAGLYSTWLSLEALYPIFIAAMQGPGPSSII